MQHSRHRSASPDLSPTHASEQSSAAFQSNLDEVAQAGLGSGGVDASEMGIEGGFAGMVLDCLPMVAAVPLAKKFASNPAVKAWAETRTLDEVIQSLQGASNRLLAELWPVGVGVFVQGRLAGQMVGGVDSVASVSAVRTHTHSMELNAEGSGRVCVSGGPLGLAMFDRFGEVSGAMAKAGLKAGVGFDAHTVTEFDAVELLSAAGHLGKDLNLFLSGGLNLYESLGSQALDLPPVPQFLGPKWRVDHRLFFDAEASADLAPFDAELEEAFLGLSGLLDGALPDAESWAPIVRMAAQTGLVLTIGNDGRCTVEGRCSAEAMALIPTVLAESGRECSAGSVATLSDSMGGAAESSIRFVFDRSKGTAAPILDASVSGITQVATGKVSGVEISDSIFTSLDSLSGLMDAPNGDSYVGLLCGISRTVAIDLNEASADEHCPELIRQVVGFADAVVPSRMDLRLVGTASFSADALAALTESAPELGRNALMNIAGLAMDRAAGAAGTSVYGGLVNAAASEVVFSDARVVGTVFTGQGGGVEGAMGGAKAKAVAHTQQGFILDRPISTAEAERVREALRGGHGAV